MYLKQEDRDRLAPQLHKMLDEQNRINYDSLSLIGKTIRDNIVSAIIYTIDEELRKASAMSYNPDVGLLKQEVESLRERLREAVGRAASAKPGVQP